MGTVAGVLDARGDVGVLWVDAHGDINTPETTPSGNVHGMPVATMLGLTGLGARLGWTSRTLDPRRVVLFGTRTLDSGEQRTIRELGVRMFTMSEIDQRGIKVCLDEVIERLSGVGGMHISFDIDAVDPLEAPGVDAVARRPHVSRGAPGDGGTGGDRRGDLHGSRRGQSDCGP